MRMWQVLVGVFWPSMMKLRSQYVPEDLRATILNLFRTPLNLFVCLVLYNVGPLTPDTSAFLPCDTIYFQPCFLAGLRQSGHWKIVILPLSC